MVGGCGWEEAAGSQASWPRLRPSGGRELGGPGRLGWGKASEEGGEKSKHVPSPAWAQAVPSFASDPRCLGCSSSLKTFFEYN